MYLCKLLYHPVYSVNLVIISMRFVGVIMYMNKCITISVMLVCIYFHV